MTFFGMLMNSPHTWLQGMCHHKKRRSLQRFPQVVNERIIANALTDGGNTTLCKFLSSGADYGQFGSYPVVAAKSDHWQVRGDVAENPLMGWSAA